MRVVAFTGIPGFQARSTEIVNGHLLRRLRGRGVTVVEKPLVIPSRWAKLLPQWPLRFFLRYLAYPLYSRACWWRYRESAVYYVTEHANAMLAWALPRKAHVLVQVHDLAHLLPLAQRPFPASCTDRLIHWLSVTFKRPGIIRADHVLAISEATRQQLIRFLGLIPEKITNLSCGVDREVFSPGDRLAARQVSGLDQDAQYLMTVAAPTRQKNVACLLRALARLSPTFPRLKLIYVGRFDRTAQRIIQRCRLEDRICRFVDVSASKLVALYRAADVYVFPSFYEGFGLPAVEAMACGCCTVVAGIAALEETADGAASVFRSNDEADLAAKIEAILREPRVASELRQRGLRRAAELTWDSVVDRMLPVFEAWGEPRGETSPGSCRAELASTRRPNPSGASVRPA